eukprot:scaffold11152_cov57-Phaeocystis_antarctica.AAC.1
MLPHCLLESASAEAGAGAQAGAGARLGHGWGWGSGTGLRAAAALLVGEHVLDHERLLHDRARDDLLLHARLDLEAAGVGLGPHEARVHEAHGRKAARLLEQQRHQLGRLGLDGREAAVAALVAAAAAAGVLLDLLGDALADVVPRLQALRAHVHRVRRDRDRALAAQDLRRQAGRERQRFGEHLAAAASGGAPPEPRGSPRRPIPLARSPWQKPSGTAASQVLDLD